MQHPQQQRKFFLPFFYPFFVQPFQFVLLHKCYHDLFLVSSAQQAQNNAAAAAVHASIHLKEYPEDSRQEVQQHESPEQQHFPQNHQYTSGPANSHPTNPANVHSPEFNYAGYK